MIKGLKINIKNLREENGVIMLTVIALILVLSIVVISIMSLNIGQAKTGRHIADEITAEQLATGLFFKSHQALTNGMAVNFSQTVNETIDNKTYSVSFANQAGTGVYNTQSLNVLVNYQ